MFHTGLRFEICTALCPEWDSFQIVGDQEAIWLRLNHRSVVVHEIRGDFSKFEFPRARLRHG